MVGGYGIEIDSTTPFSPPGTKVLAQIPNPRTGTDRRDDLLRDRARRARLLCRALDFSGSITFQPVWRMLDNLWRHMTS
jgi:hypothetical protein